MPTPGFQPIEKPQRIHDQKAIDAARRHYCEFCGRTTVEAQQIHVHHVSSKGSGGDDKDGNLISLCFICHDNAHRGLISRERLRAIIAMRA